MKGMAAGFSGAFSFPLARLKSRPCKKTGGGNDARHELGGTRVIDLTVRPDTIKCREEQGSARLPDMGLSDGFCGSDSEEQVNRNETKPEGHHVKLKSFLPAKETI